MIGGNISTKQTLHQLLYLLNYVHTRAKSPSENPPRCPILMNSAYQSMEEIPFKALLITPNSPIKKWYQILCLNLLPRKSVLSL